MELTDAQYERIAPYLPQPSGHTKLPHRQVLNALLYVAEQGCKWRALPESFGPWHTVYQRLNRWAKRGVLERVFAELQRDQMAGRHRCRWTALIKCQWGAEKTSDRALARGLTTKLHGWSSTRTPLGLLARAGRGRALGRCCGLGAPPGPPS